jgi:bleomycin hydrolase
MQFRNIKQKYSHLLFIVLILFVSSSLSAQYTFTELNSVACTPIKNQQRTGTCWSFATSSFLESELARMGKGEIDLSEMYVVRSIYQDKARNYMLRQGKANFSQGSLAHDLINIVKKSGVMPEAAYDGKLNPEDSYDHSEMEAGLKGYLDGVRTQSTYSKNWNKAFNGILDAYMGEVPSEFEIEGKLFTPSSYANYLGINPEDYVSITSFSHHPFGTSFILEIPDNYSNGSFYNMPLDELMTSIDQALEQGYSVAWDGDVSEKGFSSKEGLAILPVEITEEMFEAPVEEISVTQALRQEAFENLSTTDDHLMHIVGSAKDQNGKKYYLIKNSWGERGEMKGYLYMSEAYMRMKTVFVMMHKDVLSVEVEE